MKKEKEVLEFIRANLNKDGAYHNDIYNRKEIQDSLKISRASVFRCINHFVANSVMEAQENRKGYFIVTV